VVRRIPIGLTSLSSTSRRRGFGMRFGIYPMQYRTNAQTGSVCYGLGGLTANEMQFINGVGWTENGATFASASSQYAAGSDTLVDAGSVLRIIGGRLDHTIKEFGRYRIFGTPEQQIIVSTRKMFALLLFMIRGEEIFI
jgi:hypothetical protein